MALLSNVHYNFLTLFFKQLSRCPLMSLSNTALHHCGILIPLNLTIFNIPWNERQMFLNQTGPAAEVVRLEWPVYKINDTILWNRHTEALRFLHRMEVTMAIMVSVFCRGRLVSKVLLNSERRVGAFVPISPIKQLVTPRIMSLSSRASTDLD